MKKIITILTTLALTVLTLSGCGANGNANSQSNASGTAPKNTLEKVLQQGYITVAISPDFGPYEFIDLTKSGTDAVVGCEVEFAKYIASELGVDLVIEQMDFSTCQAAVSTGKVDFSTSGYAKTEERAENMECSDYYNWEPSDGTSGQGIIVKSSEKDQYKTAQDFSGKIIAAQNGSLQMNLATGQLPEDIIIEPISSINDAIMMLVNGKVDAIASSYDTGLQFCKNYDTLSMAEFMFAYESEGNIALVQKGQIELVTEINKIIAKATAENKFTTWLEEAKVLCDQLGVENNA